MNMYISLGNYIETSVSAVKSSDTVHVLRTAYASEWLEDLFTHNNPYELNHNDWIVIFKELLATNLDESAALSLIISLLEASQHECRTPFEVNFDERFFVEVNLDITDVSSTVQHLTFMGRSAGFISKQADGKFSVELKGQAINLPIDSLSAAKTLIIEKITENLQDGTTPFNAQ